MHEGDFGYLSKMVDEIAALELKAVKFHLLLEPLSYLQAKHPLVEQISSWCFTPKQWSELIDSAQQKGLDVLALCDDVESIEFLLKKHPGVFAIELHSTGINDHFLLNALAGYQGFVVLGVGGTTLDEVQYAIEFLNKQGKNKILLMHGFQSYPTDYRLVNLSRMDKLSGMFDCPVGYADHTAYDDKNNITISCLAASIGHHILEKHFTLDHGVERVDYHAAVGKEHMQQIKELMQIALDARGQGLTLSQAEKDYGKVGPLKKAVVARKPIAKGETIELEHLWFKRTVEESAMKQSQFLKLIGLKALKNIQKDEIVDFSKVDYDHKQDDLESFTHVKKAKSNNED